jgi:biopolymer transport protein ExbD
MNASILQQQQFKSPLESMKRIQAGQGKAKEKNLFFELNLTTLIDAFCILVIFLLSNMDGQLKNLTLSENMTLPSALQTETLEEGVVVRIENNELFLDDQKIKKDDLAREILKAKKTDKASIIIQADRRSDYENIGMVLRAGGQAGFDKYVFAVTPGT